MNLLTIIDNPSDSLEDLLVKTRLKMIALEETVTLLSNPAFTLTGSRRFGTNNEYSDYDFFIKESLLELGLHEKLRKLGFRRKSASTLYRDVSLSYVMGNGFVDIQVISDDYYDAKVKAQFAFQKLVDGGHVESLSKSELRQVWTNLIISNK